MTDAATSAQRTSPIRIAAGVLFACAALVIGVLVILGVVNPWRLVFLQLYFGVPTRGFVQVLVLALVAVWLLTPLRNEARQRGRAIARATLVVLLVIGLICWGLQPNLFGAKVTVLATSADGERQIALYEYTEDDRKLVAWAGKGLAAREVGSFGRPCGTTVVRFLQRDEIEVQTPYGTWRFLLDPATGTPLGHLGPTCSG